MEQEKVNEITKRTEPITTRSDRQISNDDQYISDNLKEKVDQIMDSTQDPAASNDYLWPDWVKAYQVKQLTFKIYLSTNNKLLVVIYRNFYTSALV